MLSKPPKREILTTFEMGFGRKVLENNYLCYFYKPPQALKTLRLTPKKCKKNVMTSKNP